MNWNMSSYHRARGTALPGSARGPRAVFGGSPKTLRREVEPFDEASNVARQRRALPNPQNLAC